MRKLLKRKLILYVVLNIIPLHAAVSQEGYHIPKAVMVPANDRPHQLHTETGYGEGFYIGLSYSVSNKFTILVDGFRQDERRTYKTIFGSKRRTEISDFVLRFGLARSYPVNIQKISLFEVILGSAYSHVDRTSYFLPVNVLPKDYTETDYLSIFAQSNLVIAKNKYKVTFSLRISGSFYDKVLYYEIYSAPNKEKLENFMILSADPAVSFNYTIIKNVELVSQAGLSMQISHNRFASEGPMSYSETEYKTMSLLYKIGIQYKLSFDNNREVYTLSKRGIY